MNFSVSLFVRRLGGYGSSSIGRVAVSKTVGWGFKSLLPCQPSLGEVKVRLGNCSGFGSASQSANGEVAEWSIAAVLKTASGESLTGVRIPPSPPALLEEWKLENFCEQYVNHSLGGRHWSSLWLLMVAGTASAFYHLLSGNASGIGKMFVADVAGIKGFDRADFCFTRIARRVHRRGGFGFYLYFY